MAGGADKQVDETAVNDLMRDLGYVICLPLKDTNEWCRTSDDDASAHDVVVVPKSCPRRDLRDVLRAHDLPVPDWLHESSDG